jgi:hypothetical protein
MKKRRVSWSNCTETGKDGGGAIVGAGAAAGTAGFGARSGADGADDAGAASRLGGTETGGVAPI